MKDLIERMVRVVVVVVMVVATAPTVYIHAQTQRDTVKIKEHLDYILQRVPDSRTEDSLLNEAIRICRVAKMPAWELRLLNFWSQQKVIGNKFPEADSLITQALYIAKKYQPHVPSLDYRDALFQKANVKFYLQQWDSCLQIIKELQLMSRQAKDYFNESISITNEANIYAVTRKKNVDIEKLYQKAYTIAQQTITPHDDVMMLHNYAYWLKGAPQYDLGHSLKVLLDIQSIAQHPELQGYFYPPYRRTPFFFRGAHRLMLMELANTFFYLGNFQEAMHYIDEVIAEKKNRKFASYNIFYKAYIQTYLNTVTQVDSLVKTGLTRYHQYFSGEPNSTSYFYCLGWLAEQRNNYAASMEYYTRAMDKRNFQSFGNDAWDLINEHSLALFRVSVKSRKIKKADSLFQQMNASMTQNLTPYFHMFMLKELPAYYELKKRKSDALQAAVAYYQLKDSLTGISTSATANYYEKQFQLNEKNRLLALAKKENELRKRQLEFEQKQSLILGAGVVALLGLLLLVFYNYRLKKQQTIKLKLKNNEIETLMKELHHRVKNNLQVVTGLLSMQRDQWKDERVQQAMEEGKNRIQAMALIHQKLSVDSAYTLVNMKEYITLLSNSIAESYGYDPRTTLFHEDNGLNTISMNVEKAVPVGLLVNEIVTNAFKHAFTATPHPQVCINLSCDHNMLTLRISDNGMHVRKITSKKTSMGNHLIKLLVSQLEAEMLVDQTVGTAYQLKIPMENE